MPMQPKSPTPPCPQINKLRLFGFDFQTGVSCIVSCFLGKVIAVQMKEVTRLRRLLAIILCFSLVCVPVQAAGVEKLVALTFDDGPSGRFTRRLLEGLADRDAKATFFLCGYRLEQYPHLAEDIVAEGHEVGVHGYSHKSMCTMTPGSLAKEIHDTLPLMPTADIVFLRPPGGLCDDRVQDAAEEFGLAILQWSVDPKDWATDDAQEITRRVLSQACDGDVILLHDLSDSSVDAALMIVDGLRKKGFRFVTASELAAARNYTLSPGKVYTNFYPRDQRENK